MIMKRILLIFAVALLTLAGCRKETPAARDAYDLSTLRFEFSIEYPEASKAVKSGWVSGDRVFIFFPDITGDYLTMSYDGSAWSTPALANSTSAAIPLDGTLTALYLPYGNSATASYADSKWTFSAGTTDSYFLAAEKVSYIVTDPADRPATLVATLYMAPSEGYAQFYIPDADASGTVRLACNAVTPAGLGSIAADGTISEAGGTQGGWMTGYAGTIGDETGYYASGKVAAGPGLDCYFALSYGVTPSYKNYYKHRTQALAARGAYQLPAFENWLATGATFVQIGSNDDPSRVVWSCVNVGAADPWSIGSTYTSLGDAESALPSGTAIPTKDNWNALLSNANWLPMTIHSVSGFLIVDKADATRYFFLPRNTSADYWSASSGFYFQMGSGGENAVVEGTPASAYLRVIYDMSHKWSGSFTPPVGGSDI